MILSYYIIQKEKLQGQCPHIQTPRAIPHKERLATLHAICLQISLQSLFRIFPHASCVHIFRDISGKYSKIHKGFSPFFPSSLKKSDDAICIRQIRNRLSYFTKMLVNTASIHSAFCFIWRKIWRRICRTIFVRYCPKFIIARQQQRSQWRMQKNSLPFRYFSQKWIYFVKYFKQDIAYFWNMCYH